MTIPAWLLYPALAMLAAGLGFSAHRAGLCTVRAVSEITTTRRAHMLASFFKSAAWVLVIATPMVWLAPAVAPLSIVWPTLGTLLGGILFGAGAAVNNGCAISTLTRLGSGDAGYGLTLAGLGLGAALAALAPAPPEPPTGASPLADRAPWTVALWAAALAWAAWEARRLFRTRRRGLTAREHLLSDRMRLSVAALLIGAANALLCAVVGAWAYTGLVVDATDWLTAAASHPPDTVRAGLLVALMAGVTASAVARGSFRWRTRPSAAWLRHLGGGILMGVGIAVVPGGNDAILMHALPALSPHALPAYGTMLAGVAAGIALVGRLLGAREGVRCGGDVCDRVIEQ
ncbi:YeeE/YedE thiosulfate transporter family protein [Caenispirillum salinarum]|uniref:YeeE/YedE thiosulfate transporter family protein n=1 Tax=Caenispirillum salinarum TaxID=859058 RepID=UPI00384E3AC1